MVLQVKDILAKAKARQGRVSAASSETVEESPDTYVQSRDNHECFVKDQSPKRRLFRKQSVESVQWRPELFR